MFGSMGALREARKSIKRNNRKSLIIIKVAAIVKIAATFIILYIDK